MSLILEALRKSEAERRRGQVPDLHGAPSPGAQPLRGGPPAWLWPSLALAIAVALAIALWLARSETSPRVAAIDAPDAPNALPGSRPLVSDRDTAAGGDTTGTMAFPGTPGDGARPGELPALAPLPSRQADVAPPPATTATRPATAPTQPLSPAAAVPAQPAAGTLPPATAVAATRVPIPPSDSTGSNVAGAPPSAAPGSSMLRLSDLTVAQRQRLPPLKMSMHMHSATQRFAIIDGTRVAPGDRIGEAVVEEITTDGVVLDWQGQRLQIPIR